METTGLQQVVSRLLKEGLLGCSPVWRCSTAPVDETITTPAGFTITPESDGSYRICDLQRHCLNTNSLWEAQQLVQWAEVHHQGLPHDGGRAPTR
ncbi:MAG: hypothetical protein ACKO45_00315 [Cyanobium sp.]